MENRDLKGIELKDIKVAFILQRIVEDAETAEFQARADDGFEKLAWYRWNSYAPRSELRSQ